MKIVKRTVSLILVFIVLFNMNGLRSNAAVNSYYYVSVTPVQQLQSNWCWAACAQMAGKAKYPSSTRTQIHVVNHLKGTYENPYPNVGGYPDDIANGSTYVAYNTVTFSYSFNTKTFSEIATCIQQGNPVIVVLRHYSGLINDGSHAILIYGAYVGLDIFGIIDPLDGEVYTCGYSYLQNGSYMNGYIYKNTIYI